METKTMKKRTGNFLLAQTTMSVKRTTNLRATKVKRICKAE